MIYIIGSENCWLRRSRSPFVKIGTTIDIRKRLAQFQTDNPHLLKVHYLFEGGEERERELHALFERWHYRNEWFRTWVQEDHVGYSLYYEIDKEWLSSELPLLTKNRGVIS